MTEKKTPAFEAGCSSIDEFLRMLELRESEDTEGSLRPAVRRAVFVGQLQDYRGTSLSLPSITRYVHAAFCYGEDLVSMKVYTSRGIEMPHGPDAGKPAEKQTEAFEEITEKIRERVADALLDVPVVEGFLHHAIAPRHRSAGRGCLVRELERGLRLPTGYRLHADPDAPRLVAPNGKTVATFGPAYEPAEAERAAREHLGRVEGSIEELEGLLGRRVPERKPPERPREVLEELMTRARLDSFERKHYRKRLHDAVLVEVCEALDMLYDDEHEEGLT